MSRTLSTPVAAAAAIVLCAGCEGLYVGAPDGGDSGIVSKLDSGPSEDAGTDAGLDGGPDAGTDAGFDGGTDAGFDGGSDAGLDGGPDGGGDAGTDAGFDAGVPSDGGPPVTTAIIDWSLRGSVDEFSIGSAASGSNILWIRYVSGTSGKITTLSRTDGGLIGTQLTDLGPYSVISSGDTVGLIGRGVASISDWRVLWLTPDGNPLVRSDTMNVVTTGAIVAGAMYQEPGVGLVVHVVGPKNSSGTFVSALTHQDGGVGRTETTCANTFWWDAANADNSNRRFFIGGATLGTCNLGNGQFVGPSGGQQVQWLLARYSGVDAPGVPTVRVLTAASTSIMGPAALGANSDSVWVGYYTPGGHLRLERFSVDTVVSQLAVEAVGQAYVTGQTELGLSIDDIIPDPVADRVYVLVNIADSKCRWSTEPLPTLNGATIAVYAFDKSGNLLKVVWVPSTNAPKTASTMALIDGHLVISGQCLSTPSPGTTDPLCTPTTTTSTTSFLLSIPAP